MPLRSKLFASDKALEACLTTDTAHLTPGSVGEAVSKIHTALLIIDNRQVSAEELKSRRYGQTTAAAVLAYKTKRSIVNPRYQTKPDDIVGKMTIASMDDELMVIERSVQDRRIRSRDNMWRG